MQINKNTTNKQINIKIYNIQPDQAKRKTKEDKKKC